MKQTVKAVMIMINETEELITLFGMISKTKLREGIMLNNVMEYIVEIYIWPWYLLITFYILFSLKYTLLTFFSFKSKINCVKDLNR